MKTLKKCLKPLAQTLKEWRVRKIKLSLKTKLIILASLAVAVILTATVLLFTLFALDYSKVDLNFLNASSYETNEQFKQEVLNNANIKQRTSVFFLNKTKAKNALEKTYPNLKVVNIETTFPNGLKIHIAEREELFAIHNEHLNLYSIIDADFKILRVLDHQEFYSIENKPILIKFVSSSLINLAEGDFVLENEQTLLFSNLAKSLLVHSRDVEEQKQIFKEITLLNEMFLIELQDGFEIKVHSPSSQLHAKIGAMLLRMGQIYPDYQTGYTLEIYLTQNNDLISKFTAKN